MLIRIVPSIVDMKGNINFKIFRSAENLTVDTTTSFVDSSFKYFMVIRQGHKLKVMYSIKDLVR